MTVTVVLLFTLMYVGAVMSDEMHVVPRVGINGTCPAHRHVVGNHCCLKCPDDAVRSAICRPPRETQCDCGTARWHDHRSGICRSCGAHFNSDACQHCPQGMFRSSGDVTADTDDVITEGECVPCSHCRRDQVKIQNCTHNMDTVCMDESFRLLAQGVSLGRGQLSRDPGRDPDMPAVNNTTEIIAYCSLLASVIIALILYVVLRWWRARHQSPHKISSSSSSTTCNQQVTPHHVTTSPPCTTHVTSRLLAHVSDLAGSRTVSTDIDPGHAPGHARDCLRDLSSEERLRLETCLSQENSHKQNWIALAHMMEYSADDVSKFLADSQRHQCSPARLLIADWSRRPTSNVTSFVRALTLIGRLDLAALVDSSSANGVGVSVFHNFV